jgi:GntR family transcriptional regulator
MPQGTEPPTEAQPSPRPRTLHEIAAITDPQIRAQTISHLLAEQQALLADLARMRREAIADLRSAGLTQAQIASVLGVTPGRVAQLSPSSEDQEARVAEVVVERALPSDPDTRASRSLYLTETEQQGIIPRRVMLQVGAVPAPAHIAPRLRVAEGDPIFVRRKLMFANEVPIRISSSYFPLSLVEGTSLSDHDFVGEGFQVLFERLGYQFGHAIETLTARMPTPVEAHTLRLASDVPVVQVLRSSYDINDNPIHTLESICAADRHVFPVRQAEGDNVF